METYEFILISDVIFQYISTTYLKAVDFCYGDNDVEVQYFDIFLN